MLMNMKARTEPVMSILVKSISSSVWRNYNAISILETWERRDAAYPPRFLSWHRLRHLGRCVQRDSERFAAM